jgi:hypothetical protein
VCFAPRVESRHPGFFGVGGGIAPAESAGVGAAGGGALGALVDGSDREAPSPEDDDAVLDGRPSPAHAPSAAHPICSNSEAPRAHDLIRTSA